MTSRETYALIEKLLYGPIYNPAKQINAPEPDEVEEDYDEFEEHNTMSYAAQGVKKHG